MWFGVAELSFARGEQGGASELRGMKDLTLQLISNFAIFASVIVINFAIRALLNERHYV